MRLSKYMVMAVMAICISNAPAFGLSHSDEMKKDASSVSKKDDEKGAGTTGIYLQQKRDHYLKKAEAKLRRIEDRMKRLIVRAEKKGVKAREMISRAADDLENQSKSVKNRLVDLKESGEETWDHARTELDSMLKDLERSYSRIAARVKN